MLFADQGHGKTLRKNVKTGWAQRPFLIRLVIGPFLVVAFVKNMKRQDVWTRYDYWREDSVIFPYFFGGRGAYFCWDTSHCRISVRCGMSFKIFASWGQKTSFWVLQGPPMTPTLISWLHVCSDLWLWCCCHCRWGDPPLRIPVSTRILPPGVSKCISCWVAPLPGLNQSRGIRDPLYKPSFAAITGKGPNPNFMLDTFFLLPPSKTPLQNGTISEATTAHGKWNRNQGYRGVQVSPPTEHIKGLLLGPWKVKGCGGVPQPSTVRVFCCLKLVLPSRKT